MSSSSSIAFSLGSSKIRIDDSFEVRESSSEDDPDSICTSSDAESAAWLRQVFMPVLAEVDGAQTICRLARLVLRTFWFSRKKFSGSYLRFGAFVVGHAFGRRPGGPAPRPSRRGNSRRRSGDKARAPTTGPAHSRSASKPPVCVIPTTFYRVTRAATSECRLVLADPGDGASRWKMEAVCCEAMRGPWFAIVSITSSFSSARLQERM